MAHLTWCRRCGRVHEKPLCPEPTNWRHSRAAIQRRTKAATGIHTVALRKRIRDGDAHCSRCLSTHDLEVDHIRPVSKGGDDSPSNLQVLCRPCHAAKTAEDRRTALPHWKLAAFVV